MHQATNRRRTPIIALGILLALSAGASAVAIIELEPFQIDLDSGGEFQRTFPGLTNIGFTIRGIDASPFTLTGFSSYNPAAALQPGETVQEGFVLLDGTLSLAVSALKPDGTRARTLTTYRLGIRRRSLDRIVIRDALVRQGVVRNPIRALTRARAMRIRDARVMRLVEREGRAPKWIRAVRALRNARIRAFRPRTDPDGILGHFGTAISGNDQYVWAVMDRNSRYGVGLTVDRDNDGVPNAADNCIGSPNSNQSDADGDKIGDICDLDDDNDAVADERDNCPLTANADQSDLDHDGLGDACDVDDDNDGVADGADQCLATAIGAVIDATGCSIADHCPCESAWRNHGAYVQCVARTSGLFAAAGLITQTQKDAMVSAGARSICGF